MYIPRYTVLQLVAWGAVLIWALGWVGKTRTPISTLKICYSDYLLCEYELSYNIVLFRIINFVKNKQRELL